MNEPSGSARLFARFNPTSTDEEGRAFIQRRIALFQKIMLVALLAFLAFVNAIYALFPYMRPEHEMLINYIAIAGILMIPVFIWINTRGPVLTSRALQAMDAITVIGISAGLTASGILADDQDINVYGAFNWLAYTALGRSLIVPSTPKQTAVLTGIALAPAVGAAVVVDVEFPTPPLVLASLIFLVVLVVLATMGSQLIYGLRSQVKEAMQLGQYTIMDKIGEGGMGTVYRARHAMLRRPTAVKLLKPDRSAGHHVARFEREVQATSELAHPNTVAIYDYGRSPDGVFYYAMELLDGVDLETLVANGGPQPWRRVVHVLRQVCGALEEAHATGLIHRDIKPGNIILCKRGGIPDVAKVVDFGLVKDLEAVGATTTGNVVAGTPAYLAPEAVTHSEQVGPASDLYALGAVGYFMLTGKLLFEAKTLVEMCLKHVDTDPVPPSQRTDNEIPEALERVLLQCLSKSPSARPASAQALKLALDELVALDPWTEELANEWWESYQATRGAVSRRNRSSMVTMTVDIASRSDQIPLAPRP